MRTLEEELNRVQRGIEAREEWNDFLNAIQLNKPATQVFTSQALVLLYLALGKDALAKKVKEGNV